MAYIELVIKIPEEVKQTFDNAKDEDLYGNYYDRNSLIGKAIQNGIPLPKGHGRLIDENNLWFEDIDDISCVTQRNVENAPTIIEAEREEEE